MPPPGFARRPCLAFASPGVRRSWRPVRLASSVLGVLSSRGGHGRERNCIMDACGGITVAIRLGNRDRSRQRGSAHRTLATFVSNSDRNRDSTSLHPIGCAIRLACQRRLAGLELGGGGGWPRWSWEVAELGGGGDWPRWSSEAAKPVRPNRAAPSPAGRARSGPSRRSAPRHPVWNIPDIKAPWGARWWVYPPHSCATTAAARY